MLNALQTQSTTHLKHLTSLTERLFVHLLGHAHADTGDVALLGRHRPLKKFIGGPEDVTTAPIDSALAIQLYQAREKYGAPLSYTQLPSPAVNVCLNALPWDSNDELRPNLKPFRPMTDSEGGHGGAFATPSLVAVERITRLAPVKHEDLDNILTQVPTTGFRVVLAVNPDQTYSAIDPGSAVVVAAAMINRVPALMASVWNGATLEAAWPGDGPTYDLLGLFAAVAQSMAPFTYNIPLAMEPLAAAARACPLGQFVLLCANHLQMLPGEADLDESAAAANIKRGKLWTRAYNRAVAADNLSEVAVMHADEDPEFLAAKGLSDQISRQRAALKRDADGRRQAVGMAKGMVPILPENPAMFWTAAHVGQIISEVD